MAGCVRHRSRRRLPRLGHSEVCWPDCRCRQSRLPAASLCQRRASRPIQGRARRPIESGGPTDNVLPIWKAEAPAIDVLAPDIYLLDTPTYRKVIELITGPTTLCSFPRLPAPRTQPASCSQRLDFRRLAIRPSASTTPETLLRTRSTNAPNSFLDPTADNYKLIGPMMRDLARLNFEGKLQAVSEVESKPSRRFILEIGTRWFPTALAAAEARRKATPSR